MRLSGYVKNYCSEVLGCCFYCLYPVLLIIQPEGICLAVQKRKAGKWIPASRKPARGKKRGDRHLPERTKTVFTRLWGFIVGCRDGRSRTELWKICVRLATIWKKFVLFNPRVLFIWFLGLILCVSTKRLWYCHQLFLFQFLAKINKKEKLFLLWWESNNIMDLPVIISN